MAAVLLLWLCTPRHCFSDSVMDGIRGCRKEGKRSWEGTEMWPSGPPAGSPRQVVRGQQARQPLEVTKIHSTAQKGQAEMAAPQEVAVSHSLPTWMEEPIFLIKCYHHSPCHTHYLWPTTNNYTWLLSVHIPGYGDAISRMLCFTEAVVSL